jgi:hypothetical protein
MESFHIISKYAICYVVFFLFSWLDKLENADKPITKKGLPANPGILFALHIAGILWFDIMPAFIFQIKRSFSTTFIKT